jgi:BirA family biotin operon repressor/biotin-[acetyl-CoA-carboxylase] ligase
VTDSGLGRPHVHHRLTGSTNALAKHLAAGGAPHGTLVTADEQTEGRGRSGRSWSAPPGSGILMSVIVRGLDERHEMLPLATAVAVCRACEAAAAVECAIKWPNDVWVERRKLAGILIEGRPQEGWAVIGLGLNVSTDPEGFPEELRETATSLRAATGAAPDRAALLAGLLARLGDLVNAPAAEVLAAWRERDALEGSEISWNGGSGVARGVDDTGALLVDTPDGRIALQAGEVHLGRVG